MSVNSLHRGGPVGDGLVAFSTELSLNDDKDDQKHDIFEGTTNISSHGTSSGVISNKADNTDEDEDDFEEDYLDSTCHLINVVCCDLNCGKGGKSKSFGTKAFNCCSWFLWTLIFAASIFFVVLLVGAQKQEEEVRSLLPFVHKILYDTMNTGEMCAFDDRATNMTRKEKMDATQRTFSSPVEAHLAGYSILHCGACAACSNWQDLRQEYTTRKILGQVALKCAKKVLLGGGYPKLVECTMEETGFERDCAECWATDYQCVKKNCIFISIRAFMINTVTNLQVGADDITPSTCEEAKCEATEVTGYVGFVPCSGASRRRMNVKSAIARPIEQQCNIVDVLPWEEFFGPSEGKGDYIVGWGE